MKMKSPNIVLKNLQIKSLKTFKKLAKSVEVIEEECGIKETRITLKGVFFCPWIDKEKCRSTPMERLLIDIVKKSQRK